MEDDAEEPLEAAPAEPVRKVPARRATAESLAEKQREISVSEFFVKNRHLLGFDNKQKALLTAVRECVDNSLDACEEAGILPELRIEIRELSEERFRIAVEDNGPGIVKAQIPKIFGKLLYGSKFHRLKQQRGQQ
ncbi:MAG: ATP-binding protein, partial [Vicinamibacteria bacterium]|nr:ATP-binding protein [Vicinamibacteria bacterium]